MDNVGGQDGGGVLQQTVDHGDGEAGDGGPVAEDGGRDLAEVAALGHEYVHGSARQTGGHGQQHTDIVQIVSLNREIGKRYVLLNVDSRADW